MPYNSSTVSQILRQTKTDAAGNRNRNASWNGLKDVHIIRMLAWRLNGSYLNQFSLSANGTVPTRLVKKSRRSVVASILISAYVNNISSTAGNTQTPSSADGWLSPSSSEDARPRPAQCGSTQF